MICTLVSESSAPVGSSARRNFRVVDQSTGDGHPLHLAAGHLIGLFVDLIGESHLLKGGNGSAAALISGNTGKGQRQLHVGKRTLWWGIRL